MEYGKIVKILEKEKKFVLNVENECVERNNKFCILLENAITDIEVEHILLEQVRFVGQILETLRKKNSELIKELNMNYAKIIGLVAPYDEAICSIRKVKKELDTCLKILRDKMLKEIKKNFHS